MRAHRRLLTGPLAAVLGAALSVAAVGADLWLRGRGARERDRDHLRAYRAKFAHSAVGYRPGAPGMACRA